ncbi:MAG: efflux RND transporter periplasmic adaptor subunit [Gallionellaceae bacterium]|nr:MAG: efflux RND transporter periplasmic adaptor subunit [Gallionellaceae bacterium]
MRKPANPTVAIAAIVLFIAVGLAVYFTFYSSAAEPKYRTQTLEKGNIQQAVSANGTINPMSLVNVGTQVSGAVKKLYVDFNSKVKEGQVLLELDSALFSAQLKQSQASAQIAAATLEQATANEARARSLFEKQYASHQELDAAIQAKKAAEAQLQLALATVEKDRTNLAYTVIRSPVSGVVVDRSVDIGQTVAASLQTPTLFKIAQDLSRMQIHANFAEADIGSIRVGQAVRFTADAFTGRNFTGEVKQIRLNPIVQQSVVTYDVVVNVDNPEQILMPGMTAYVSIAVQERKDVLLVPNAALRFKPVNVEAVKKNGGDTAAKNGKPKRDAFSGTVYLLQGAALVPASVTLGITDNRNTEIVGGDLKAGDQVVVGDALANNKVPANNVPPMRRMF